MPLPHVVVHPLRLAVGLALTAGVACGAVPAARSEPLAWTEGGWAQSLAGAIAPGPVAYVREPASHLLPKYGGKPYSGLDHDTLTLWEFAGGSTVYVPKGTAALRRVPVRWRPRIDQISPPAGSWAPGPRYGGAAVFDPILRRLVIHGGISQVPGIKPPDLTETASIFVDAPQAGWQKWDVAFPFPARSEMASTYDPVRHRMLVYGGRNYYGANVGQQLLALSLDPEAPSWSLVDVGSSVPPGVQERTLHGFAFDRKRYEVAMLGGGIAFTKYKDGGGLGDFWALSLANPAAGWRKLEPTNSGPAPYLSSAALSYDANADRYYLTACLLQQNKGDFGYGQGVAMARVWEIERHEDDTFTWRELRTVAPLGVLSFARAHWHWETHAAVIGSGYSLIQQVLAFPRRFWVEEVGM